MVACLGIHIDLHEWVSKKKYVAMMKHIKECLDESEFKDDYWQMDVMYMPD